MKHPNYLEDFPEEVSRAIQQFIDSIKKETPYFFGSNLIIRDDIFSILEKTAIVVFYPLEDENDGFHIQRTLKGKSTDFVYINTSKAIEKQIFTAAHELGHRLDVEKYISECCKKFDVQKYRENVVNRFATLLLVPENEFRTVVEEKLKELKGDEIESSSPIQISLIEVFRLTAFLMDYFFVPFKTIVYRYSETGIITKDVRNKILSNYSEKLLTECISEGKYLRLNTPNNKKSIADYAELLEKAESLETLPVQKIRKIRVQFDIPELTEDNKLKLMLTVKE